MTVHAIADSRTLATRSLRHIARSPDTIITTALMPVAIMLLFVYVFGGAIDSGDVPYVSYVLPGILLITTAMSVSYASYRLFMDVQSGIVERFRSMPIARTSVLWAHVLTALIATAVSLVIVLGVAVLMGFRSGAGLAAWLAVVGLLALLALAFTWFAVLAGLSASSVDGASAFSYPLILLPFISSAFVPTDGMPGPVRWFAEHQPVTPIVDTIRALLAQEPVGGQGWRALGWCIALAVGGWALGIAAWRRRTR
ncbi:ABC transporter permease [uncultured Demequina sp.]|uniref:ABC transporter permease n=1 Tax=uncultured Demequina sp. TaxID=693499 RepID=UPI0025E4B0FA|nr:ABC transporter permease [uncultured Demequina sp.]